MAKGRYTRHGHATGGVSKEYYIWADMVQRCTNPKHRRYSSYGGRGITLHPEWRESFAAWFAHIGPRTSPKHSQDRIDNELGYIPGNVRWATAAEQQSNKRNSRIIHHRGRTMTLVQWAEYFGVHVTTLHWRLTNWGEERAMNTPFRKRAK